MWPSSDNKNYWSNQVVNSSLSVGLPAFIVAPMTRDISIWKWSESQTDSRYILLYSSQDTGISYVFTMFEYADVRHKAK